MGAKGQATRQKLIKTARDLFKRKGFNNTSIGDILQATGVNRGNLYFHFKGKDDLAIAVLRQALEGELRFLERLMEGETDPLQRVYRMIDGIVAYNVKHGCKEG